MYLSLVGQVINAVTTVAKQEMSSYFVNEKPEVIAIKKQGTITILLDGFIQKNSFKGLL